jgi:hypothetical protein
MDSLLLVKQSSIQQNIAQQAHVKRAAVLANASSGILDFHVKVDILWP